MNKQYESVQLNDRDCLITRYTGSSKVVEIPSEIDGYEVVAIGAYAFSDMELESVHIPNGVVEIGEYAFGGNYLEHIELPEALRILGEHAFQNNDISDACLRRCPVSEDDRSNTRQYLYSIANGNLIQRYSLGDYRSYIYNNPETLVELMILYFTQDQWDYKDPRRFKHYDEQWLAGVCDANFRTELLIGHELFIEANLLPWQQTVVRFTKTLISFCDETLSLSNDEVLSEMLYSASPLEHVYSTMMNIIEIDVSTGFVLNEAKVIKKGLDMLRLHMRDDYEPPVPLRTWETELI